MAKYKTANLKMLIICLIRKKNILAYFNIIKKNKAVTKHISINNQVDHSRSVFKAL